MTRWKDERIHRGLARRRLAQTLAVNHKLLKRLEDGEAFALRELLEEKLNNFFLGRPQTDIPASVERNLILVLCQISDLARLAIQLLKDNGR